MIILIHLHYFIANMLPLDLWQFGVIDYLEYEDQSKLVKLISGLELTNLVGIKGLTNAKLKEFKCVKWLDASFNNKTCI
jgi:hypothetical protein